MPPRLRKRVTRPPLSSDDEDNVEPPRLRKRVTRPLLSSDDEDDVEQYESGQDSSSSTSEEFFLSDENEERHSPIRETVFEERATFYQNRYDDVQEVVRASISLAGIEDSSLKVKIFLFITGREYGALWQSFEDRFASYAKVFGTEANYMNGLIRDAAHGNTWDVHPIDELVASLYGVSQPSAEDGTWAISEEECFFCCRSKTVSYAIFNNKNNSLLGVAGVTCAERFLLLCRINGLKNAFFAAIVPDDTVQLDADFPRLNLINGLCDRFNNLSRTMHHHSNAVRAAYPTSVQSDA